MGMFDVVLVPCPKCKIKNALQSKGGDCEMLEYELDSAPVNVLLNINDTDEYGLIEPVACEKCKTLFYVHVSSFENEIIREVVNCNKMRKQGK